MSKKIMIPLLLSLSVAHLNPCHAMQTLYDGFANAMGTLSNTMANARDTAATTTASVVDMATTATNIGTKAAQKVKQKAVDALTPNNPLEIEELKKTAKEKINEMFDLYVNEHRLSDKRSIDTAREAGFEVVDNANAEELKDLEELQTKALRQQMALIQKLHPIVSTSFDFLSDLGSKENNEDVVYPPMKREDVRKELVDLRMKQDQKTDDDGEEKVIFPGRFDIRDDYFYPVNPQD